MRTETRIGTLTVEIRIDWDEEIDALADGEELDTDFFFAFREWLDDEMQKSPYTVGNYDSFNTDQLFADVSPYTEEGALINIEEVIEYFNSTIARYGKE